MLTAEERNTRVRAAFIRKSFERHTEMVRDIVARMSDEDLIAMEAKHMAERAASAVKQPQLVPVHKAAVKEPKVTKRRWFGLRRKET
jgi:hypothetical protein